MLFPEKMRNLTIVVHNDFTEKVVDELHEEGVVEIESIEKDEKTLELVESEELPEITRKFTDYDMKLSSVLDVFEKVEKGEEGIKEMINPSPIEKLEIEKKSISDIFEEIDGLMEENGKEIIGLDSKLEKIKGKIAELDEKKEDLKLILDLDLNLETLGRSTFTTTTIGKTADFDELKKAVDEIDEAFCEKIREVEEESIVFVGVHARKREDFQAALREGDFRELNLSALKGDPKEALAEIESKIKKAKKKKKNLIEELRDYKEDLEKKYLSLKEELEINREKKEVVQNFGSTETTTVIKAWTPKKDVEKVEELILESSNGHAEITAEIPSDPDEVPISLKNPRPVKPFELLTNMFAPPNYDEVDPTLIVAPAFVLFFGLMLGDLIYGLIIATGAVAMIKGPGKVEDGIKNFGWIMLATGLSTIFFGALQGGYLGPGRDDYPNLLGHIGIEETPALLETLEGEGPLILLILSLVIGLTYINVGLVLQLIQHIRRKDYKKVILENASWWLLQIGGFILISDMMFEFGFIEGLPGTAFTASYGLVILGLILLAIRAKGLSFFELTGFIGDLLSFSRILALGLATAGIALTVNIITDLVDFSGAVSDGTTGIMMVISIVVLGIIVTFLGHRKESKPILGGGVFIVLLGLLGLVDPAYPLLIIPLIVFILGHVINLALQGLGSFVHSLRLQYVEFFGYFYEGGGKEFEPFTFKREYTKLKSEEDMER